MKVLVCIPARYSSTRFTGKVLARDTGKFLIQHTYEQACLAKLPDKVIIAADDERIASVAESFGAQCILTSPKHKSGTDRVAEAILKIADSKQWIANSEQRTQDTLHASRDTLKAEHYTLNADDIIVNLQADEPEIDPENIDYLAQLLIKNPDYQMATLATNFQNEKQIADPDTVKVICSPCMKPNTQYAICNTQYEIGRAIYFSRAPIPYDRERVGIGEMQQYLRHIGIYAYRKQFLLKITSLPQTPLEKIEKLEQLRAIEHGFSILVGRVEHTFAAIDTPAQYAEFVNRYLKKQQVNSKT